MSDNTSMSMNKLTIKKKLKKYSCPGVLNEYSN